MRDIGANRNVIAVVDDAGSRSIRRIGGNENEASN
jgi:hypothetical protein